MVTYQLEPWSRYYPECIPLWDEHYTEFEPVHLGRMEMAPDVEMYRQLDAAGRLQITVARESGVMVGYVLMVIRPHVHYCRSLCGFEDSYFLTKRLREGAAGYGYRLIKASIEFAKQRGAVRLFYMTKEFNSIAAMFDRMGMDKIDTVHALWL